MTEPLLLGLTTLAVAVLLDWTTPPERGLSMPVERLVRAGVPDAL